MQTCSKCKKYYMTNIDKSACVSCNDKLEFNSIQFFYTEDCNNNAISYIFLSILLFMKKDNLILC